MNKWKKINDCKVLCFWKKADTDDCQESEDIISVTPDWYEQNGTPICSCGEDMVYSHTEIVVEE